METSFFYLGFMSSFFKVLLFCRKFVTSFKRIIDMISGILCHYESSEESPCHSERSEESRKLLKINMMRFLIVFRMTNIHRVGLFGEGSYMTAV